MLAGIAMTNEDLDLIEEKCGKKIAHKVSWLVNAEEEERAMVKSLEKRIGELENHVHELEAHIRAVVQV